jgi:hypothetical protein
MKKYLLPAGVVLAVAVGLGLLLHTVAREAIRQALIRAYQAVHGAAAAIPQQVYLAILILLIVLSAARSILGETGGHSRDEPEIVGGRAAEWRERLQRAARPAAYQAYYRWQVARNLAKLAAEVVAHQQAISPGEAERQIEDGDVALPAGVRDYVLAGLRSRPVQPTSWWTRLSASRAPDPLELDPQQVVEALESYLEVSHGHPHP